MSTHAQAPSPGISCNHFTVFPNVFCGEPRYSMFGGASDSGTKITVIICVLQTPRDNVNRLYVPEPLRNQHDMSQTECTLQPGAWSIAPTDARLSLYMWSAKATLTWQLKIAREAMVNPVRRQPATETLSYIGNKYMSLTNIDFFSMLSFNEKVISTLWKLPFQFLHLSSVLPGFPWVLSIFYLSLNWETSPGASILAKEEFQVHFYSSQAQVLISRKIPGPSKVTQEHCWTDGDFLRRPTFFFLFLSFGFCFCFALFFLFLATSLIRGQSESFLLVFCKEIILF